MIIEQGSIQALKDKHLKITWNLISFCNFHCPYCLDLNSPRMINYQSEDEVNFAISNLLELPFNSFEFYLLGGEPTLYPHLEMIVNKLLNDVRVKRVYIMTNGSNDVELPNNERLFVVTSVHPLSVDKIRTWNKPRTFYNLLAYPKAFDLVKKIFSERRIDEITVVRKPPTFENIFEYTNEQPHQLYHGTWKFNSGIEEKQPRYSLMEFNQEKYLNFQDMYCFNNSLNIQSDGRFRYTCYDSTLSNYSIFKDKIQYHPEMKKCRFHFCNCAVRLNMLKIRD